MNESNQYSKPASRVQRTYSRPFWRATRVVREPGLASSDSEADVTITLLSITRSYACEKRKRVSVQIRAAVQLGNSTDRIALHTESKEHCNLFARTPSSEWLGRHSARQQAQYSTANTCANINKRLHLIGSCALCLRVCWRGRPAEPAFPHRLHVNHRVPAQAPELSCCTCWLSIEPVTGA